MKKFKTISLLILISIIALGSTVFAVTGTVNAPSGLVLRGEASKEGTPLDTVPDKTELEIIKDTGEWCKVTYNGKTGYLFGQYVNRKETPPQTPITPETPEVTDSNSVQAKSKIKVYMIPVITSTVINEIEPNAQITIEKQITNWSYIVSGNIQGWVRTYGIQNEIRTPEAPTKQPTEIQTPTEDVSTTQGPTEQPSTPTATEPENPTTSQPADNSNSGETAVENVKGFVAVDYANVRKVASTSSEIVTTLTKNTSFTITAETEEWYKITYTGLDGTVYVGYIYKNLATK